MAAQEGILLISESPQTNEGKREDREPLEQPMDLLLPLHQRTLPASWVAIGAFDGVHRGHQVLFQHLVDGAHQAGLPAVVITFEPLPGVFFNHQTNGYAISSLGDRLNHIRNLGVDDIIVLNFTREFADIEAAAFMQEVKTTLGLQKLIAGFNFTLGRDAAGDINQLQYIGEQLGFSVYVEPPVLVEGKVVSSSNIRNALRAGDIRSANAMLGRRFTLGGEVIHGEHRGGKLGIPTANLAIATGRLLPANGVYVTRAHVGGKTYDAVTNVGVRPTFENPLPAPRIEPHLLDTQEDFYRQQLCLEFFDYLRAEQKFANPQALVTQIQQDIVRAREVFAHEP